MINDKKVVAFICECNPFHAGHKCLINAARKEGDILIAIMSGNFVQRGEPAVYNKYQRTNILIKNGVDLVIELPIECSLASANIFASSSIYIINKLGFVDKVIFGSNINDIRKLSKYAEVDIYSESNTKIRELLKEGYSYPKIISNIYGKNLSPNDILAVEYIRAINKLKSKIIPICIKRSSDLPTASELRKKIAKRIDLDSFSDILNYKILSAKNDLINYAYIQGMTLDMYNSLINSSGKNLSFEKRSKLLNAKNRTLSNIKRTLLCLVFDIKKTNSIKSNYIRILGLKKSFLPYLKNIKIPYLLSYSPSSYRSFLKNFPTSKAIKQNKNGEFILSPSIKQNIFATNFYNFISNNKMLESTTKTIIL